MGSQTPTRVSFRNDCCPGQLGQPTCQPTSEPTQPTSQPTSMPSTQPSGQPSVQPTKLPTEITMRLKQSIFLKINGVTREQIGTRERICIGDAIFRSAKYNYNAKPSLNSSFIETVDVDGYDGVYGQYLDEPAANLTYFGTFSLDDEDADTTRRTMALHLDSKGAWKDMQPPEESALGWSDATSWQPQKRQLSNSYEFEAHFTLITHDRFVSDWSQTLLKLLDNMNDNVENGYFNDVMQLADTVGPGFPNYDGHYFEHRRLGILASAIVDDEYGIVPGNFEAQNLYGNSPSGMPSSAPIGFPR